MTDDQNHASSPSRRHLLVGAAWTTPIIAVAAATPFAAASPASGSRTLAPGTQDIRIGATARNITFTIVGGGGGGLATAPANAHRGARIVGSFTLPVSSASRTIRAVVGAGGGINGAAGGTGFGNGGTSGRWSGGGGSAILVDNILYVVAGGGGGRALNVITNQAVTDQYAPIPAPQNVPAGSSSAAANGMARTVNNGGSLYTGAPGLAGNAAVGGAGGTTFYAPTAVTTAPGIAGGSYNSVARTGGNGGAGVAVTANNVTSYSGGGGGGYAGGGSGGTLRSGTAFATTGGGGGGSNFLASGVTTTVNALSTVGPNDTGHPGSLVITWS